VPGPPPKPSERRQWRGRHDVGLVAAAGIVDGVPPPPAGVLKATREAWDSFFESPVAGLVDRQSDLPALARLFVFYDDAERSDRAFRKQPFIEGSQGQPVVNPMGGRSLALQPHIRALEDRFGLSPLARLKLGVKFGEAARSLDELNRSLLDHNAEDEGEEEDPRIVNIR
jgi:hypothetical protein